MGSTSSHMSGIREDASNQLDGPENQIKQPPKTPPRNPHIFSSYECIAYPSIDELKRGAYIWDQIATQTSVSYAFVGGFAALLMGAGLEVFALETIIASDDIDTMLKSIREIYATYFVLTQTNVIVIIIRENKGVSLELTALGTNGFPNTLRPVLNQEPNLFSDPETPFIRIVTFDRMLPVLRPRLLLQQRLLQIDRSDLSAKRKDQYVMEMKAYLKYSGSIAEVPFTPELIDQLLPAIRRVLNYGENIFIPTSLEDVNAWRRLGVPLQVTDISATLRTPNARSSITVSYASQETIKPPPHVVGPVRPVKRWWRRSS